MGNKNSQSSQSIQVCIENVKKIEEEIELVRKTINTRRLYLQPMYNDFGRNEKRKHYDCKKKLDRLQGELDKWNQRLKDMEEIKDAQDILDEYNYDKSLSLEDENELGINYFGSHHRNRSHHRNCSCHRNF